ncbi:MAG: hypothetical protein JRN52_02890 [Nitrososphaerota archaeon]|nr:hypothetical protein [Nitrososphaerota archaeon]
MGVKKKVQSATSKLTSRVTHSGVAKRLTSPGASSSYGSRGIEWLYMLVLFLLTAGLINATSNAGQPGIGLSPIVASPTAQNITETFIMLFGYIMGSLGAYGLYLSGRQTIRARSAEMFFVGGIALIAVGLGIGYFVLSVK